MPASTAKQLHAAFGTPQPRAPRGTPDPEELLTIEKEMSLTVLKRRSARQLGVVGQSWAEARGGVKKSAMGGWWGSLVVVVVGV